jgi:hypothetical protein
MISLACALRAGFVCACFVAEGVARGEPAPECECGRPGDARAVSALSEIPLGSGPNVRHGTKAGRRGAGWRYPASVAWSEYPV